SHRRYLRQVGRSPAEGDVVASDEEPAALGDADRRPALPGGGPWRLHFHVPLHHEAAPPLAATTRVLRDAVAAVRSAPHGAEAHLDVETYTWSVLPPDVLPTGPGELVAGIAAELRWARENLLTTEGIRA